MSKKKINSRCLVVDASIAGAAGSRESQDLTGILCRDFLIAVRGVCHRIAWTETMRLEWDKHQTPFAQQWRVSMLNLKKLRPVESAATTDIHDALCEHCDDEAVLRILLKDRHLIGTALATDSRVASLDQRVRRHFETLATDIQALRTILWVNPAVAQEKAMEWVENGAPNEKARRLRKQQE
jgi:hypothetical protein